MMKKSCILSMFVLIIAPYTNSQDFTAINTIIDQLSYSSVQWADFDRDGDLDIVVSGRDNAGERTSKLFMNDEGEYTPLTIDLVPVDNGFVSWGDFDMDHDLDLLLTGNSADGPVSLIYENLGSLAFANISAGIIGVENGKSAWGDFDCDGDLDLFITGNWTAKLYENEGGTFQVYNHDFGFLNSGCAAWGDVDNDGDLDLLLTGDSGAGTITRIYKNTPGGFEEAGLGLQGTMAGKGGFVDYNNDGLLDIYLSGFDDSLEPVFLLYQNTGNGSFEPVLSWITGVSLCGLDWGDFDVDGDLDLVITGKGAGCGLYVANIYRNEGDHFEDMGANLVALTRGSAQWGDYDNDGDLDILMSGMQEGVSARTLLYRNNGNTNQFQINTPPEIPSGLSAEVDDNQVTLRWDPSEDAQTIFLSLNYNVRLGKHAFESEIMPPMSDMSSGERYLVSVGNVGQNTQWTIKDLDPGLYYWSVQAIDQAYAGSGFAETRSFQITTTYTEEITPDVGLKILPNPTYNRFLVQGLSGRTEIKIFNTTGEPVLSVDYHPGQYVSLNELPAGMYLVQVYEGNKVLTTKVNKL